MYFYLLNGIYTYASSNSFVNNISMSFLDEIPNNILNYFLFLNHTSVSR